MPTLMTGCRDSNGRIRPPDYNPNAGAAACELYDSNRDGVLDGDELRRVPGLLMALKQIDADGDGRLAADEIDGRVKMWTDSRIAEMPVRVRVTLDGAPLENAQVVFDPEPFLGKQVHPASGVTAVDGVGGISMASEHLADPKYAGVACGWYKVRVTCPGVDIPARYNTETTLGCEVAPDAYWVSASEVYLPLKSNPEK